jgi:FlaG/FlaF family flagellin (archaellin)
MKRLILILSGIILSSQIFSVQLENVSKGEFDITSTTLSSNMISIDATGKVGKYGRVYVSYNLHIDGFQGSQGMFEGQGMNMEGVTANLTGIWKQQGSNYVIHSLDDLNNGDHNLVYIKIDTLKNKINIEVETLEY